ncbi:MAG: DUF58 domain-containing protein [Gemmataceae bacterium]|nr:DUF58 domain-containing protein [Gemmataceae bacterium]
MLQSIDREKIRALEIRARKALSGSGQGRAGGILRGMGLEFSGLREYQPGDDIRHLDWKASARLAKPLCREFLHDRETTLLILFDGSSGMDFGPQVSKREMAAEIALILGLAAILRGNRLAFALVNEGVRQFIPPTRDEEKLRWMAAEMLEQKPEKKAIWPSPWDFLTHGPIKRSLAIFLSDFWSPVPGRAGQAALFHDLHFFRVLSNAEISPPGKLDAWVNQPGENKPFLLPWSSNSFHQEYLRRFAAHREKLISHCAQSGIGFLDLCQGGDPMEIMARYFRQSPRVAKAKT